MESTSGRKKWMSISFVILFFALIIAIEAPDYLEIQEKVKFNVAMSWLERLVSAESNYRSAHRIYSDSFAELEISKNPSEHYEAAVLEADKSGWRVIFTRRDDGWSRDGHYTVRYAYPEKKWDCNTADCVQDLIPQ